MVVDAFTNCLIRFGSTIATGEQHRQEQREDRPERHITDYSLAMLRILVSYWAILSLAFGQVMIPAGSVLQVRLKTKVSTSASKANQAVEAVTIRPVVVGDQVLLPAGVPVKGKIAELKPTQKADERATLKIQFTDIAGTAAQTIVTDVDNARESVDEKGMIVGILASETIAARIDQGIGKVAERRPGLADLLEAAKGAVLSTSQPTGDIDYDPGVEFDLKLTAPLTVKHPVVEESNLDPISNEDELIRLVNAQPFQTIAENPPKPSDITNLMFIGTEQQIRDAFGAAGWAVAHVKNQESVMETVRAIAEVRGYKEAPMSTLLLEGRKSDLDFQKQNNTFAKRHHLRIWKRPDTFDGKPIWVSSSTHDTGIEFSQANRTFIHTIDPAIDRERAKVVSDLLFTKRVKSLALAERPAVPKKSQNATGDNIETDGRMAVLVLQ